MASESSGSSFNVSQSTSTPQLMDSAQSDWGLQQSQFLNMLANQTYNWAMQQYAKGEPITDQAIGNFMEMSGKGKGLADTLLHQYQDQVKPLMDQYFREAGSYASEGRQRFEAGQAESTVAQADQAAMKSAMEKISGYGGNVNAGKTQEMIIAGGLQDAAARAGAGTKAASDTADKGRAMLEKSIAMGQQVPGQAMNAINSAYAGLTGAENALLGFLNTGKNLADAAAPYHNAAVAANKLPPVANRQQSTSQGGSQQQSKSTDAPKQEREQGEKQPGQGKGKGEGEGEGRGKGDGKGDGSSGPKMAGPANTSGYGATINIPQTSKKEEGDGTGAPEDPGYTGPTYVNPGGVLSPEYSPGLGRDPNGELFTPETAQWDNPAPPSWTLPDSYNQIPNIDAGADMNVPGSGGFNQPNTTNPFGNFGQDFPPPEDNPFAPSRYGNTDPDFIPDNSTTDTAGDPWGNQDFSDYNQRDDDIGGVDDDPGDTSYPDDYYADDTNDTSYPDDYYADDTNDTSYPDDYYADDTNDTSYPDDPFVGDDDTSDPGYDYPDEYDNYDSSYDDYSGYDSTDYGGGDYGGYDEFARGGQVRPRPQRPMAQRGVMPTTGGAVPRSASPSQGRQTDDISARLNAGEFVIPRDVVKHQGTKFFSDLIAKSRKLRTGMAGPKPGPTMRPSLPQGPPSFRSRPLPPR